MFGSLLLYLGAECFVRGASALASALKVSSLVIGLTVVAYGTSAPELIVSVQASMLGRGDVALGNVIGSNIANVGLILGAVTVLRPLRVQGSIRRRELPFLVLSACAIPVLLLDGALAQLEGVGLLSIAFGYSLWLLRSARSETIALAKATSVDTGSAARVSLSPVRIAGVSLFTLVGLGVLLAGGYLFVNGAVLVARTLGMSDQLVGLTIVAVGTSLPELITCLVAAARNQADLALGNVIGSNIFNVFLCLGAASSVGSLGSDLARIWPSLGAMLAMTAFVTYLARSPRLISRPEGSLLLALYFGFLTATLLWV